ncbi:MAG: ABC transporter substrate-binding protein [Acidobacteriales bacterium 59-55]|nr:ABC transporter permease [Terriglobales bacterium]OJV40253.1 MAG: ABC transporter substrate-binding protein [Acidobacteriales bacterium 59-55]
MRWFKQLFTRHRRYNEISESIREHIDEKVTSLMDRGMSRVQAERAARREFGNVTLIEERSREVWQWPTLESIVGDVRFALRQLRKSPGFTATAILTLALCIGANAIVFSLLYGLVLRPLNVPEGRNLYQVEVGKDRSPGMSYPDYVDLRDRNRSFDGLIAYEISTAGLDTDGNPSPVWLHTASGNYFDVLGIHPYLGRFFHSTDENGPNSAPYIVLSYAFWQSHFQSNKGVVGRTVRLNKFTYTILGVAPPGFRGTESFYTPALWAPIVNQQQIEGSSNLDKRGSQGRWVIGRLKGGMTPAQATENLNSIATSLAKEYPKEDTGMSFALARPGLAGDMLGGPVHAFVAGLMLLAGLILLAACANLGSLFSARAADRSREIALRVALGSSRGRILRQLLTEAVLVAMVGGAMGLAASVVVLRWLSAWQPIPDMPINITVHPDARTYIVSLLLALASGLLFGMVPVRQVLKADPYQGIKAGAFEFTDARRRVTLRDVLLTVQIAVCAVLVTSSLVAVRGMVRSLKSNFGFVPQNTMQVNTDLNMAGYSGDQVPMMQKRILDAVQRIPGVTAAGYASRIPLNLGWSETAVFSDSTTDYKMSNKAAQTIEYYASPGYFQAAGTTLLRGRTLNWNDSKKAPRVAVVNQEFARKLFGSEGKDIGSFFKIAGGTRVQVVGLVEDGKYGTLSEDPKPAMFLSILQTPSNAIWILVRSNLSPQELGPALERTLHGLDPGLPFTINTWEKELGTALFAARAASMALGVLGALGAILALTGIFGIAAYSVSHRLRELGIRIALGARRKEVLETALGRVFRLLTFGSLMGLLLGLAATRVLSFIVYQATPRDPLVLTGVVLTMLLIGILAIWLPAQRALSVDPLALLREE